MYQPNHKALAERTAELYRRNRGKATAAMLIVLGVTALLNLAFYAMGVLEIPDLTAASTSVDPQSPAVSFLSGLASLLVTAPLTLGMFTVFSRTARGEEVRLSSMFDWVSDLRLLFRAVGAEMWLSLLYAGWLMLGMLPGIAAAYLLSGYSPSFALFASYALLLIGFVYALARVLSLMPALFHLSEQRNCGIFAAFDRARIVLRKLRWRYMRFLLRYVLVLLGGVLASALLLSVLILTVPALTGELLFFLEYLFVLGIIVLLMPRLVLGMVVYWQDAEDAFSGKNPPNPEVYGL